jgi:hypothetical protein
MASLRKDTKNPIRLTTRTLRAEPPVRPPISEMSLAYAPWC